LLVTKGRVYKNRFIKKYNIPRIEPVIWISKFKVICIDSESTPICIKRNAFGKNYPFRDLYVSPYHSLFLNGKMILAKNIVNGKTIYQDNQCNDVEYYHLECEYHSIICANGILSESYLESNNRRVFSPSSRLHRIQIGNYGGKMF